MIAFQIARFRHYHREYPDRFLDGARVKPLELTFTGGAAPVTGLG